jgi:hypothetical protein
MGKEILQQIRDEMERAYRPPEANHRIEGSISRDSRAGAVPAGRVRAALARTRAISGHRSTAGLEFDGEGAGLPAGSQLQFGDYDLPTLVTRTGTRRCRRRPSPLSGRNMRSKTFSSIRARCWRSMRVAASGGQRVPVGPVFLAFPLSAAPHMLPTGYPLDSADHNL